MTIGELIKTWRKEKGLTQKQLAEKTGIATITIQQYEGGKRVPKAEFLARIAQALEISEHDFWEASLSAENDGFYDKVRLIYGNLTVENIFKYVQHSNKPNMNGGTVDLRTSDSKKRKEMLSKTIRVWLKEFDYSESELLKIIECMISINAERTFPGEENALDKYMALINDDM